MNCYYLHYQIEPPSALKKWDGFPITDGHVYGVDRSRHGFVICKRTEDISSNDCIRAGLEDIAQKFTPRILTGLNLFAVGGCDAAVTPGEEEIRNYQRILQEVQRGRT